MGRKAIRDTPMTATERKRRERARREGRLPGHGTVLEFRLALLGFVDGWREQHPALTTAQVVKSLDVLELALRMDEHCKSTGTRDQHWVLDYLNCSAGWTASEFSHDNTNWR